MADCLCCECESDCRGSITLDQWRETMCLPAYSFFQLGQWRHDYPQTLIPINESTAPCSMFTFERCHQNCQLSGRDQVCEAIQRADRAFLDFMHYPSVAKALCTEFFFGSGDRCLNVTGQKPWRGGILQLDHYKIKQLGKQTLTPVATIPFNAASQMSDTNGDALWDKATLVIDKPAGVAADEIALFFVEADRGRSKCCRWEIGNLTVKDTGTTYTITIPSWVMVKPYVYDSWKTVDQDEEIFDPQNATIYPTELSLYRRWVDTTKAVTIYRKPMQCTCGQSSNVVCSECSSQEACILSAEQGIVEIKIPHLCGCCQKCIDRVCINYVAGGCNNESLIARLAASFLQGSPCCSPSGEFTYWQQDFVTADRGKIVTPLSAAELASVFGTKRGGVEAYRELRQKRKMRIATI